jgi:hypothetical protein
MLIRQDYCLDFKSLNWAGLQSFKHIFSASFCLLILIFSSHSYAQVSCASSFSESQVENLNQLLLKNSTKEKYLRKTDVRYRVAVRATVFYESSAEEKTFSTADVKLLIQHANTYLNSIDVELYLQNETVNHVSDKNYNRFLVTQETQLRAQYDVTNALNLYFFNTISTEDGVFLNGSAALPNLSNNSNRIFLSYLDRNQEDFKTLKNKVFPHELGHYFGLLHTFRDSNNPDVNKRELVMRDLGSGANCDKTGDYLCDTPSDPFERLTTIYSYNCNDKLPPDLVDAYGYSYAPPADNIMSYHVRCGNVFTNGQYQRMKQSFSIRFSPNAAYNLLGNQANYLIVNQLSKSTYCEGEEVLVTYSTYGDFAKQSNFVLEMSDSNGENFKEVNGAVYNIGNEIRFRLPNTMNPSSNYQFRVISQLPFLISTVSKSFTVHTKGTLKLSLSENIIRPNNTSNLFLDFTGSGPWEVVFENGIMLSAINNRRHQVRLKPTITNSYKISSAVGLCGNVAVENDVTLVIAEPSLKVDPSFTGKSCQQSFFQIPVSGLKSDASNVNHSVKLSNADTTFNTASNVFSGVIFVLAPSYFSNKSNVYDLVIEGASAEDYSLPVSVKVNPKPATPQSSNEVSYCFNTPATPLKANGSNIKWYFGQTDIIPARQLVPKTTQTGVFYFYVTQTNGFGCESSRKEIQVKIKEPATAAISGNNTIKFGDRVALAIKLSGDAPWNFELSDGQKFETPEPEIFPEVQPSETEIYTIRKALNTCGEVFLTGSAKIVVLQPLANSEEWAEEIKVFPNPVTDVLQLQITDTKFVSKPFDLSLTDMLGRRLIHRKSQIIGANEPLIIEVVNVPAGVYVLKLQAGKYIVLKRIII